MKQILIKPHITEKSIAATSRSCFTFVVDPFATKSAIKHAVESTFKVHVTKVTTCVSHLPAKRTGSKRQLGNVGRAKVATLTLKKGETIALFEFKDEK